ncbi:hypothetical protein FOL46_009642 [Perkinsus olseni]|nr:hypothetical protein FOL46_009642 [Perkinsus olseni]
MGVQDGLALVGKRLDYYRNPKASNAVDILDAELSLKAGDLDPPRKYLNPETAPTCKLYDLGKHGNYNFSSLDEYLNDPLVMRELAALQARLIGGGFQGFSLEWYFGFGPQRAQVVLDRGLRVLIYAGDQDYLCNWFGNQAWTNALPWAHRAECNNAAAAAEAALAAASFFWSVATKTLNYSVTKDDLKRAQFLVCSDIHTMELWWTSIPARARAATIAACAVRGSVVHFSGHQATESVIKLTSLATFAGEQGTSSIKKFEYGCTDDQIESERAGTCSLKMPDPVWMVALRALSMVNNSDVEYNLLEKNCELFCCWCELGARSGIVNFASPEKRAIGQSDPERFRRLSSLTSSLVQSLGFRDYEVSSDAHVAAATAAVDTAAQSALKHSDSVTAVASVFLRTPSSTKDGNLSRYRAIVAKVFALVPADPPKSVDEAVNSNDITRSISVVDAIVIDISENPRLLQNTEYITSPMNPDEWKSALQSALFNIDRLASRT